MNFPETVSHFCIEHPNHPLYVGIIASRNAFVSYDRALKFEREEDALNYLDNLSMALMEEKAHPITLATVRSCSVTEHISMIEIDKVISQEENE
jgi:hypothetical protein